MTQLRAVTVVTGSDTVSNAVGSIENLRSALPGWCDIVMAYSAPPPSLGARVRAAAGNRSFVLHESAVWMSQNRSRNRALEGLPPYDYYLFLDLDSRVETGGLESAVATRAATGADLIGAVIVYDESVDFGRAGKRIVHYAGGYWRRRPDADGRPGMGQIHEWVGEPLEEVLRAVGGRPWETAQVEFHGMLLSRRALEALAPFDPNMIVFENCDVALRASALGLRQVMDPNFVVTYAAAAGQLCDVAPYREHWATDATDQATRYFARKYGVPDDGEVVQEQCAWNRRHYESIGVVTRPRFPAPSLRDLFDHPFAQTWPQLLAQLLRQGWAVADVEAAKRCHEVGRQLANGRYRASGKTSVSHLIGTASILAAYGATPILVESALVHTAYDDLRTAGDDGAAAQALRQRVGTSVDRILRAFSERRHLTAKPPASEEEFACYPLDDARSLILRVAKEVEDLLDGGRALTEKRGSVEALTPHACAILPRLGFFALLAAYESAIRLDTALVGTIPVSLHEQRKGSYRLSGGGSAATLALPDSKWAEVADYLTRNGRESDLAAGPHEFQYLAPAMRGEVLAVDPWADAASDAIIAIHKGRLAGQSKSALAALMRETPVFANDVFVLFSRRGSTLDERDRVHLGPIVEALGNGKY